MITAIIHLVMAAIVATYTAGSTLFAGFILASLTIVVFWHFVALIELDYV